MVLVTLAGVTAGACQEPDPNYGDPNGIIGKKLPGEKEESSSGTSPTSVAAPTTSLSAGHSSTAGKAGGAPAPDAAGKAECLQCHNGSGPPKFAFGGRVEAGGNGVADVVVTVTGLDPVKTDAEGYFWQATGTVAASSNAKVQKADSSQSMGGALAAGNAGGGCQAGGTCHGGATGAIHL